MRQAIRHMPSFPDIPPAYQQHSLPRPVSAESNFSAAASSPSTYMTQVLLPHGMAALTTVC